MSDQPKPKPGEDDVTAHLVNLILERQKKGVETYGSKLMTFNGRDALRDLLEDLLDASQYVTQAMMERDRSPSELTKANRLIQDQADEIESLNEDIRSLAEYNKELSSNLAKANDERHRLHLQVNELKARNLKDADAIRDAIVKHFGI